jgi:hypothetical protein
MSQQLEMLEREKVLDKLDRSYERVVRDAKIVAREIAKAKGRVTSVEVLAELRQRGYSDLRDTRWLGCIFRRGWRRIGWEPTGSHCRPVAIWTLREG